MARTPKAVKNAAKLAEDLHAEHYPEDGEGQVAQGNQEEGGSGEPDQQEGGQQEGGQQETDQQEGGQQEGGQQEGGQQEGGQQEGEDSAETWKQRYKSLQGRYNSEVPNLAGQVRKLEEQLDQANEQVRQLTQENESLKSPGRKAETSGGGGGEYSLATQEEIEEYGEDFVNFIQRVANQAAAGATKDLTPEIEKVKGEVMSSRQSTARQSVYQALDQRMPNWRDVNKDPGFVGWLGQTDPISGQPRRKLLMDAFEKGDSGRVVAVFEAYAGPQQHDGTQQQQQKMPLDQLAGPQRATPAQQPQEPPAKPTWTRKQIADFYTSVQKGLITGEAKAQKEADLAAAMAEGRIT